jgi:hypothetical protein
VRQDERTILGLKEGLSIVKHYNEPAALAHGNLEIRSASSDAAPVARRVSTMTMLAAIRDATRFDFFFTISFAKMVEKAIDRAFVSLYNRDVSGR